MDSRGMHESQVQNEIPSDEFELHPRLPSLQEMAYNQITIAVWYSYRSTPSQRQYEPYHPKSIEKLEVMDCHKLIKTLTVPRFMKEILRKYLKRVREETIRCTQYFRYELLSENLEEYRIAQVDWEYFVWCPDGRINYKTTAIKMLHSHVLTEVQKFAIMSNFCLENEIKIFDLNHLPVETFITKVNEHRDSLLFYWICYLKNELRSMTSSSFSIRSSYHDNRFHLLYGMIHGAAFEYFWNPLSAEDQVSFIDARLSVNDYLRWHRRLFYNMSHDQLTNLLSRQRIAIILVSLFIGVWDMPEWAIMVWKRCKNWTSNEHYFVHFLESVIHSRFDDNPFLRQEHKMSVLLEIWNTANDHLRNYAARQTELEETVLYPMHHWRKLAPSTFKFLLNILSLKSAQCRKNLILEGDPAFIFKFDLNVVCEIFELCLPNFLGQVDFSKYAILHYFCTILYTEQDHDELNRRLLRSFQNLNIPSNDVLKNCIESLITAHKRKRGTYYPSNGNDKSDLMRLSKFIAKILQENLSAVLKMKQSFISSFSDNSDPYERYGSLYELSKLIEQEFVHEHLQLLKHRLAEILQTASVEEWVVYVHEYEKFTGLFSWYSENEEEMFLQVKRSIPINNIVGEVLEGIVYRHTSVCFVISHLNNLERFLKWYFSGVAEKVISFKLAIMNDLESTKILECIQDQELNQRLRGEFLQWHWPV